MRHTNEANQEDRQADIKEETTTDQDEKDEKTAAKKGCQKQRQKGCPARRLGLRLLFHVALSLKFRCKGWSSPLNHCRVSLRFFPSDSVLWPRTPRGHTLPTPAAGVNE